MFTELRVIDSVSFQDTAVVKCFVKRDFVCSLISSHEGDKTTESIPALSYELVKLLRSCVQIALNDFYRSPTFTTGSLNIKALYN